MNTRTLLLAAAASLSFTACSMNAGANADASAGMGGMSGGSAASSMTPTQAQAYVRLAASSDMFEIESSRLALQRSQNAQIRQFAQMMIDHHTDMSMQLSAAARASGQMVPTAMVPAHAQLVTALRASASVGAFDRLYVTQQRLAHQQALALHTNYAARGDTPALRTVANAAVPAVRAHLQQSQSLPR
jgi:putative membrane protein